MTLQSLAGQWQVTLPDGVQGIMKLPGTLDESGIGHRDTPAHPVRPGEGHGAQTEDSSDAPIATRFTRKHTYEGEARISRRWNLEIPEGKRAFVEVERARCLRLLVDGREMEPFEEPTLVAPHVFEVTGVAAGEHLLTFISDNSYPGLPHDDIVYSSAATDETQTNWNGLLGYIRLRVEERVFLSWTRVYPRGNTVTVKAEIDSSVPYEGVLTVASPALAQEAHTAVCMEPGRTEVVLEDLPLALDTPLWEEEEGNLCRLTARLSEAGERIVAFGVRSFGSNGRGRLALNGRTIFLRGEANCAVFPETGYCPMDQAAWENILGTYRSYGVNCVRFHSHCPPEAAFAAADGMGMLLQPELSHWNPRDAFLSEESFSYYRRELRQLLLTYANHPGFVMLTLGNELHTSQEGHRRMDALLDMARSIDDTRMYSRGSNEHYGAIGCGEKSDFYTSQKFLREDLRGTSAGWPGLPGGIQGYINHQYPHTKTDYSAAMKSLRQSYAKPVFSFEVGQFEVLPDFRELEDFRGVLDPANYRLIQKRVREKGLEKHWERYVEATGELARIGYREEIEAAMRTREMSGISLLRLQDFPGQGTALVGMLNAHLKPKPYPFAEPEAFHAFFRAQLPLVKLDRYTYEVGETLTAEVELANYGRTAVRGVLHYALEGGGKRNVGTLGEVDCPCGENTFLGKLAIPLTGYGEAAALQLQVWVGEVRTTYPVWVYPPVRPICPPQVYETRHLDDAACRALAQGQSVYLAPDSTPEQLPRSIQAQFTTDFWSVGTFPGQEGGMGMLIDEKHPLFQDFPTSFHSDWQWWSMAVPRAMECIVTEMDSYAYLRPMARILECRCGGGRLLISSLGLHSLRQYPEARALQSAIYRYLSSPNFAPRQEMTVGEVRDLVV